MRVLRRRWISPAAPRTVASIRASRRLPSSDSVATRRENPVQHIQCHAAFRSISAEQFRQGVDSALLVEQHEQELLPQHLLEARQTQSLWPPVVSRGRA